MSNTLSCADYKSHSDYLTAMKVIATILVVYAHGENIFEYAGFDESVPLCRVISMINVIAVPIFYLISGYLLFNKPFDVKSNINKKIHSLLIPFLVWNTLWFLFEMVGSILLPNYFHPFGFNNILGFLKIYFGIPLGGICPNYDPLWFVRDLFVLNLFAGGIRKIYKHTDYRLILFLLAVLWFSTINSQARQAICFWCLGGLLGYHKVAFVFPKPRILAVLFGILGVLIPIYSTNMYLNRFAVLCCLIFAFAWISCIPDAQKTLGRFIPFSFSVYVMHGKLLSIVQIIMVALIPQTTLIIMLEYLIIPPIIIGLCVMFSKIMGHSFPYLFAIAMGNRYVSQTGHNERKIQS